MDPIRFVNSLVLADSEHVLHSKGKLPRLGSNKSEGYVDAGGLVSFTEKLTGQNKADVLNSTLLAQLAASKKHDRQTESDKWYKEYTNVLMNVGWVVQDFTFTEYNSKQESFEISKVVVELLLSLVGDEEPLLVDATKKTLEALKNSSSDTLKLFGSNSSSGKSGNFQIVPCTVDKSGQVTVAFIASYFNASSVNYDFLFFTYQDSAIKLKKSTDTFTLNEEVYAQVRQAIVDKLGARVKKFVKDLDA
ncbi:Hypothetical predicted protein [Paramuricea clavata]|uniref:Uncharacterized protein n=1 Tax=Paramuricea clavata TaxID=317549 RepID=A0A6S7IBL5_PARCT|nr:Hypothetical predicted protein [Paramuricea clavata]